MNLNKSTTIYNYLLFLVMFYMTIDLASMVFAYKIIMVSFITAAASSLIFPLTYAVMDIIAEVYGYQMAKKIIWFAFLCDFIFASLVYALSHIPSINPIESTAFLLVLGQLLRAVIAQTTGVLVGSFINVYLITKWKLMTNGKHFWLRSIGSSSIGEAFMLITSALIALLGVLPFANLISLIFFTYIYKVIFAVLAAPFVSLVAAFLKTRTSEEDSNLGLLYRLNKKDFSPNFQ